MQDRRKRGTATGVRRAAIAAAALAAGLLAFGTLSPARAERAVFPDSIRVDRLAELPRSFVDRFVLGGAGSSLAAGTGGDSTIAWSRDGLHLAFFDRRGTSVTVVVDGVAGTEYQVVHDFVFSHDAGHYGYLAWPSARGGNAIVVDGREYPVEGEIVPPITLSPGGEHFACIEEHREAVGTRRRMFTDTDVSGWYRRVTRPVFSPDGSRLAYFADRQLVLDGITSDPQDQRVRRRDVRFDITNRALYRSGTELVRELGPSSELEPEARDLHVSRDGQRCAYVVRRPNLQLVVVDGVDGPTWNEVVTDTSLFSPDGKHVAYWGRKGGWFSLVVDGKEIWQQNEGPRPLQFTPEGAHVVHVQNRSSGARVLVDTTPDAGEYDDVREPRVGVGGRCGYVARRGFQEMAVVDGAEGPRFDRVDTPAFSDDGTHVAYTAWTGSRARVIADGRPGPEFDAVIPGGPAYRPDGTLEYLAVHGNTLVRVRHEGPH